MGFLKSLKAGLNDVSGTKWAPAAPLPDYVAQRSPQQQAAQNAPTSYSAADLLNAFAMLERLKSEWAEALHHGSVAEARVKALQEQAVSWGHRGAEDADMYASGLPTYFTTGQHSSEAMQAYVARQQVLSLLNAAQVTLAACKANAQAKETVYKQNVAQYEACLQHMCKENESLKRDNILLKKEQTTLQQKVQIISAAMTPPQYPATPPLTPRSRQHSYNFGEDERFTHRLSTPSSARESPAFGFYDMFRD